MGLGSAAKGQTMTGTTAVVVPMPGLFLLLFVIYLGINRSIGKSRSRDIDLSIRRPWSPVPGDPSNRTAGSNSGSAPFSGEGRPLGRPICR